MGKYQNPEISQRTTLLQAQPSDQQSQELLKQIQRRASLPYDPFTDTLEKATDKGITTEFDSLADAFDLSMGPKLMEEMTPAAKAVYDEYLHMASEKNIRRERAKANLGIGLPTL